MDTLLSTGIPGPAHRLVQAGTQRISSIQERILPSLHLLRYKTMFHGQTNLKPSTYVWWWPVKNIEYARLVHEIERWYKGKIKIQYGVMGTMEV